MKTSIVTLISLAASAISSSAFTIDFNAFQSTFLAPSSSAFSQNAALNGAPTVLDRYFYNVSGYGTVEIRPLDDAEFSVNQKFTNNPGDPINALDFQQGERVSVTFTGPTPLDVDFDFVGVSLGEDLGVAGASIVPGRSEFILEFNTNQNDGEAALRSVSWTAVPEPSTALLGGLSLLGLCIRRR